MHDNHWRQVSNLVGAAKHEVLALIPGNCALVSDQVDEWGGAGEAGAAARALTIIAGQAPVGSAKRVRDLLGVRTEVRSGRYSPTLIFILDRKLAILGRGRAARLRASLTRSEVAIETLATIFSDHWNEAEPLDAPGPGLSSLDQKVLRYLVTGVTDDVVARELDISTRTVQRHVTHVMEVLGARSRLELGIRLATRGMFLPVAS
ncbi:helix-turn-helix transcriptional regulator [Phytohabitans rumicis]|uniref:HTH luxR-type domain-containing protein n=1 Tax=Phytohabitans rumicis TaxID=1076125 RepID=A0A6V8KY84_9ACTN|nr:helix-turn-helix transcriptional regulator [Phytohabitans rumicis]GFJ86766.1 hypothetical protein Prum_004080 [Phytohabitans rumicis]